jgi:hypothetical protein
VNDTMQEQALCSDSDRGAVQHRPLLVMLQLRCTMCSNRGVVAASELDDPHLMWLRFQKQFNGTRSFIPPQRALEANPGHPLSSRLCPTNRPEGFGS